MLAENTAPPLPAPPACPPSTVGCTLVQYWKKVSKQYCNNPKPTVFELCQWIETHCAVVKNKQTTIIPEPCDESARCTALGRKTLPEHPCDQCGECLDSVSLVCPNEQRKVDLLAITGGGFAASDQSSSCLCSCKEGLESKCKAPTVLLQSTCECGCEDGFAKREECVGLFPLHTWSQSNCACVCDATAVDLTIEQQSAFPECSISCTDEVVQKCAPKVPTDDCTSCGECEDQNPCEGAMIRGDDCKCRCPNDPISGRNAIDICTDMHATLDESTCGCTCSNQCPNPNHVKDSKNCNICECPASSEGACLTEGVRNAKMSPETCTWNCDSTTKCPGKQVNLPIEEVSTESAAKETQENLFLEQMEGEANNCQCSCRCASDKLKCKENEIFDSVKCDCKVRTACMFCKKRSLCF